MGFWDGYRSSLKAPDVEETVDLVLHRPIGYLIAHATHPTFVTPNQLTAVSILLALSAGAAVAMVFPAHLQVAALCLTLSAGFDCADGMLARKRKTSSELGRMLDGVADMVSVFAASAGNFWLLWTRYPEPFWRGALAVSAFLTAYTTQFHLSAYDHYKNVYVRMTVPGAHEGEDIDAAAARYEEARKHPMSLVRRVSFSVYLGYLRNQAAFVRRFDPYTFVHLDRLPAYDAERAEVYRRHALPPMRLLRRFFGLGSLIFTIAFCDAIGGPELIAPVRLVLYNLGFWLVLGPLQRRASRDAFRELGLGHVGAAAVSA